MTIRQTDKETERLANKEIKKTESTTKTFL